MNDPAVIRAVLLYGPILLGALLWLYRRPSRRQRVGILFALIWNCVSLLALNVVAIRAGWWTFDVEGGTLAGVPVDVIVGWSVLWTCLATLAMPMWNLGLVVVLVTGIGLWLDWSLMPMAAPVVTLHERWLVGELASIAFCLAPATVLARWTAEDRRLGPRVALHVVLFTTVALWVVPETLFEFTGDGWHVIAARPLWVNAVGVQLVVLAAIPGLAAVQDLAERGGGTPVPLDPPARLVTGGAYAFLSNPMQVSMCLVFLAWGLFLESSAVLLAGVMTVVFGIGLARWSSQQELERRFGRHWLEYRATARAWWPRWRPRFPAGEPPARLYADLGCRPCREVAEWLKRRRPVGLEIVDATTHDDALTRMAYDTPGSTPATGVAAFARALEHVHLGWAYPAWIVRLPFVRVAVQVLVDAVGGGPRAVAARRS